MVEKVSYLILAMFFLVSINLLCSQDINSSLSIYKITGEANIDGRSDINVHNNINEINSFVI